MNECPYFPFYARDWLTDEKVSLMTMEQVGVYITLLANNWISGSIPGDIDEISRLIGGHYSSNGARFRSRFAREIWPAMACLFSPSESEDGELRLCNNRMRKELDAVRTRKEKLSAAGCKGNERRWKLSGGDRHPIPNDDRQAIASSEPEPEPDDDHPSDDLVNSTPSKALDLEALTRWNVLAERHGRPKIESITEPRRKALRARLAEHPDLWDLLDAETAHLGAWARGQAFLTFDWVLRPANLAKLLEGNYRERPGESTPTAAARLGRQSSWRDPDKFKEPPHGL